MPFDQVFLMHCTPGDSIMGESGYSIRATSFVREDNTPDFEHPLLSEASKLLSYELPPAYGRSQPEPKAAPVRLAAIPIKNHNVVALMHSVYVPFDTRGRPNSYFTHVIFIPYYQFSWREALKTWGKIQWEINLEDIPEDPAQAEFIKNPHWLAYWPPHATQVLPKLDSLPDSGLDGSLLDPLFKTRPDETYFKNLLSHLCHFFKNHEELNKQSGPDNEKEKKAVLGYLLPRESPPQDGEELIGETIRATGAPALHPNLGQTMEEAFRHLLLAAYLFPVELTRPFGFSTYEPESHGEGIARGRVLTGLVKSADEPENDFLKDSLGYYPNPPGHEPQNQEANESTGHYFADLPRGLLEGFTKSSMSVKFFADEINSFFDGYREKDWKAFEASIQLFRRIKHAKQKRDYDSTVVLTKPPYWNNSHVKEWFEKIKPNLRLPYAKKCMEGLSQTPQDLEPLKILGNKEFFSWEDVCGCFCSEEFWHGFLEKEKTEHAFVSYIQFFENLFGHLKEGSLREPLLGSLFKILNKDHLLNHWENNLDNLRKTYDLFTKQEKKDNARTFFETAQFPFSLELGKEKIEDTNTPQCAREEMALFLIKKILKQGPENKWLEKKKGFRNFIGKQFSRAIANLFQTKEQDAFKRFFSLLEKSENSGFFIPTMENLFCDPGITEKDGALFREFLHTEEYLFQYDIDNFLFNCESPQSINIIKQLNRVPTWLQDPLESFLNSLTWESFIIKNDKKYVFPFEALLEGLNNAKIELPDFSVLEDGLNLRKSLMDFPNQFDKEIFSKTRWVWGIDYKEKEKLFEYLWRQIGRPPEKGYNKVQAERVKDIMELVIPPKKGKGNGTVEINSLKPPPDFVNKKLLIIYSLLKHGLIPKVPNLSEKEKLANLFRKNDTILGNILPLEADSLGTFSYWFRWFFVIISLALSSLYFFFPKKSIEVNLAHGLMIFTCFLWGCESLFSRLNNLVAKEIGGQKFISTLWAVFGITVGVLGFPFAYHSPPESNIAFAVVEFFWLAIFVGLYKDGADRLVDENSRGNLTTYY